MSSDEPQSLRTCFLEAEKLRRNATSSSTEDSLNAAIGKYEECLKIVDQVSMFSPNETLEDIISSDIQYLLIHYHLADALQRLNENRKTALLKARDEFRRFLRLLDSYDALSKSDISLFERFNESPDRFSTASTTDAAARRNTKISRFKEEKALKQKIEHMQKNPSAESNDESVVRDLHLTNVQLCVHQTFQSLESIAQELEILAMAPPEPRIQELPDDDDRARRRNADGYSERLDSAFVGQGGPILSKEGRPLRPFTLLDTRARLQQGVFRPDHNLPTMTIDEYLDEERRRGGIIEGGGAQSGIKPEVDEDNMAISDAETLKQRAWDDFKDDNPRGAGNTMNMG